MTESEWWGKSNSMHAQLTGHMHDACHDTYIKSQVHENVDNKSMCDESQHQSSYLF
jgi:hypothetical protein